MRSCLLGMLAALVILLGLGSTVHGYQCANRPRKFGCFKDSGGSGRLMKWKFNKDMESADWIGEGWNYHLHKLFCDCSKEAKKDGHRYFGLENYKECWTGNLDRLANIGSRRAKNTKCWSEGSDYTKCSHGNQMCVGTPWHMEIYETSFNSVIILTTTKGPTMRVITMKPKPHLLRPTPNIPEPPPGLVGR